MEKRTSSGCPLFVFCSFGQQFQWRATENTGRIVLLRHQAGVRDARKSVLPDMAMYDGALLSVGHAARIPSIRQQTWQHDRLSFLRSGAGSLSRQTATETFHADQRDVFSGVGESLRGGGDSFYKKRPRLPPANQTCPHLQTCTESLLPAIPARRPACEETKKGRDVPPLSGLQSLPPSGDGRDLTTKKRFTAPQGSGPARPVR